MENVVNKDTERWIRPWNLKSFDGLSDRDERFFSIVTKGMLAWLNDHIVMYDKPIKHFIFNTGSSYLYVESNGYEYSVNETTGENWMYMEMPRCLMEVGSFSIPAEELTNPYTRGVYERKDGNNICGFNAEIRRLPLELSFKAKYVLSNFNEAIVLLQELVEKMVFQKYFNVVYLGQLIKCSIEINGDYNIEFNKPDLAATEISQKTIELDIKLCTNYPIINTRSECKNSNVIRQFVHKLYYDENEDPIIHKIFGVEILPSISNGPDKPYMINYRRPLSFSFIVKSDLEGDYKYKIKCGDNLIIKSASPVKFGEEVNIEINFKDFPTVFEAGKDYAVSIFVYQDNVSDSKEFSIRIN